MTLSNSSPKNIKPRLMDLFTEEDYLLLSKYPKNKAKEFLYNQIDSEFKTKTFDSLWNLFNKKEAIDTFKTIAMIKSQYKSKEEYDSSVILFLNSLTEQILKPCRDDIAKYIFTRDKDHKLLINLLNAILYHGNPVIISLKLDFQDLPKNHYKDKGIRFDIHAHTQKGENIHIEFQISVDESLSKRILYYWHAHYSHNLQVGDSYDELSPTISVWILENSLSEKKTALSKHTLRDEETGEHLFKDIAIYLLEYQKPLPEGYEGNHAIAEWIKFFSIRTEKDLEEVSQMSETMAIATKHLKRVSNKPDKRRILFKHDMDETWDKIRWKLSINKAKKEGEERGEERGKEIGKEIGEEICKIALFMESKFQIPYNITKNSLSPIESAPILSLLYQEIKKSSSLKEAQNLISKHVSQHQPQ